MNIPKIHFHKINFIKKDNKQNDKQPKQVTFPKRDCLSIYDIPAKNFGVFSVIPNEHAIESFVNDISLPEIDENTFFIRMKYYAKDKTWAKRMVDLTYKTSMMIKMNYDFNQILEFILKNVQRINGSDSYGKPKYFDSRYLITDEKRGCEYYNFYKKLCKENKEEYFSPNCEEFKNANVCRISYSNKFGMPRIYIKYGINFAQDDFSNMDLVKQEYKKLKKIKNPTKKELNESIAKIHWLIAQESPYCRGNDSIANVLTKAIYNAYGYQTSRIKRKKSFDFEAFYRNLEDFVKVYPTLFEKEPYKKEM